ncbi:uncharacterized protein M421DRAFT_75706 [Didymella exigua CBS 183.55]|uniref:Uncharacterized protein n=1 Tax=Didymella exigua CBS 183.55 TaxID=1150837 RepID=A0A6A5R7G3_9PLEO|nr:uncharacterized protein M421DRAFT_75706 [Didymella exigua CBS 183.55]KAF1923279.1 hypothetical protein M421DRAFT_75706 [Didymella exigua CBS 183.55]
MGQIEIYEGNRTIGNDETATKEQNEIDSEKIKLLNGVAVFQEKLKEWNIPLQSILSPYAQQTFNDIVNSSEESKQRWKSVVDELNKPTKDQEEVWELAGPGIREIFKTYYESDVVNEANIQKVDSTFNELVQYHERMEASNIEKLIPETQNALPMNILFEMVKEWKAHNKENIEDGAAALSKALIPQPLAKNLMLGTEKEDQLIVAKLLGSPQSPTVQEQSNSPLLFTSNQASKGKSKAANPPLSSTSTGSKTSRSTPESLQSLRQELADDDVIEMFEYQNGVTEFGPVVAIRPCQTDNLRFTRFIIIKGTELCPGGAEALSDKNKETNFNCRERKQRMKSTPGYLKTIGPCAVMPRSEGYAPRSGSKPRRPDTYIRVMYKDDKEEWLTRTEYVQLVGQSCAERHLKALVAKYETRSKYMDGCKKAGRHPGTGLSLTQKDREEAAWLFPDVHSIKMASGKDADDDADDDTDMGFSEPAMDDGDGPSTSHTNVLDKKQAVYK